MPEEPFTENEIIDEPSIENLASIVSTNTTFSSSENLIECITSDEPSDTNIFTLKPTNTITPLVATFVANEASTKLSGKNIIASKPTNSITAFETNFVESEASAPLLGKNTLPSKPTIGITPFEATSVEGEHSTQTMPSVETPHENFTEYDDLPLNLSIHSSTVAMENLSLNKPQDNKENYNELANQGKISYIMFLIF